ncbi:HTTM domain-containing protein [Streptacidiphilus sp. PB12-B1b]|uniref:sporulation-delaying protein SdpB family protein n=1 Tax=Streptacidiphilus sp. PB12-B1b TaxID=2705012 RepID=UPI0015FB19F1|nr:sporulation-delaying protein SdpB family protein [Streptacidiphilus sp. PB12-B1b]QMU74624.1 HTTM domain-containing protein [Streptacidiphilus sp. PB12-B1b]
MNRLWQAAQSFEPRGLPLGLARSLLAFAQLTTLLLTSDRTLFADPPGVTASTRCAGLKGVSLWCVSGGDARTYTLGRVLAITVLLVVIVGYRPRWSCIAHYYVTFSIAVDVTATNGGDNVAEIFAMLLIPICLDDRRTWAWQKPAGPLRPAWRGGAFAAHAALRCQIAIIYLAAIASKLAFPSWRDGAALGVLAHDPEFGFPGVVQPYAQQLLSHAWATDTLTWSVLVVETLIALSMAFRRRTRSYGVVLAILLHGAIIVLMGLFSFGLIMIAVVLAACTDMPTPRRASDQTRQEAVIAV